jgi:hypothetical protein
VSARRRRWLLRSYPASWRERYGDELDGLLEDSYPAGLPLGAQLEVVRTGVTERCRSFGLRREPEPARRTRDGALLVLWAWAAFVIAGCAFAKFAEHWDAFTPGNEHAVPAAAYAAVAGAATIGALMVVVGAVVALPSFVRAMRSGGWPRVARPVVRALVVIGVTAMATVALAAWARHLGPVRRNDGWLPFVAAGIAWVSLVVASVWAGAAAASACARAVDLSNRQLRWLGRLSLVASACMVVIAAGIAAWWISLASAAPSFLANGPGLVAGSPLPPALVAAGALVGIGLALASVGVVKVVSAAGQLAST